MSTPERKHISRPEQKCISKRHEVLQLQNHPTTESAGDNRDDGTHMLEHAGDTTVVVTKTPGFSRH